jgi:NTP pyrophosphatase (non-canonical NTP hydrolase)
MNKNQEVNELLTIFMEECSEGAIEASKHIRFGDEREGCKVIPLENEVGDILCMIDLLCEYELIDIEDALERSKQKREKLKKWSNLKKL